MVVVFFGTPQFAVPSLAALLASRHEVRLVVTQPDKPRGRGQKLAAGPVKQLAVGQGLPIIQPATLRDPTVADAVRAVHADIGVVVAYGKLIPQQLLSLPPFGMINVHASLLPRYRGASPVHRAVINGDATTGVTIMQMVPALDAGDVLATASRAIGPNDTSDVVERGLAELGAGLLLDVLAGLEAGTVTAVPQDDRLSCYAPRLTKDEGLIDWSLPAAAIHNRVRGLYPWPHAYSYLDGSRLIVLRTHVADERDVREGAQPASEAGGPAPPGEVVGVTRDVLVVATGHGMLAIDELQPEGRRALSAREFLAGRPIRPGATFTREP